MGIKSDHLGSILTLTNGSGTIIARQNFDAWGRSRKPNDWTYNNILAVPAWLRGYTGHESLPQFGLINMNNRMYDPIAGRMLAVDNFVQDPYSTQSYNRYSYCWNNPLKFTDPSGEIIQFIIAGAIIGAYIGGSAANGNLNPVKWNYESSSTWWGIGFGGLMGALGGAVVGSGGSIAVGFNGVNIVNITPMAANGFNITAGTGILALAGYKGLEKNGGIDWTNVDLTRFNLQNANYRHMGAVREGYVTAGDLKMTCWNCEGQGGGGGNIFAETYTHFQFGGQKPLNVSTSSLDFSGVTQKSLVYNSKTNTYSLDLYKTNPMSQTALALGKISLVKTGTNQYSIQPDYYDFNIEWDKGFTKRNIATFGAGLLHYGVNPIAPLYPVVPLIFGGPYWINFQGTVTIKP